MLCDVFCRKRSFPAKTAVMVYILSLSWLKISTFVANSCISRVPPEDNESLGQNVSLLDYCHFFQTRQVPQLKAARIHYNLESCFVFMKQARREDIHTLEHLKVSFLYHCKAPFLNYNIFQI